MGLKQIIEIFPSSSEKPIEHSLPVNIPCGAEPRHADSASDKAGSGPTRDLFGVIQTSPDSDTLRSLTETGFSFARWRPDRCLQFASIFVVHTTHANEAGVVSGHIPIRADTTALDDDDEPANLSHHATGVE